VKLTSPSFRVLLPRAKLHNGTLNMQATRGRTAVAMMVMTRPDAMSVWLVWIVLRTCDRHLMAEIDQLCLVIQ
jgi:hypothetical protein